MNGTFWPTAWEDYRHWQNHDPRMLENLNSLIEECRCHPFKDTGKEQVLQVAQCRYHY